jgi:peptide/nickel transport system substrate-binding protein
MNPFRRAKVTLALAVGLLLVPVALAAAEGREDVRGGVAFVNGGEIDWIDPALDYISFGWQIEYATCAKLVNYPDTAAPAGSQLQNEVAKSIDISADGLTYTIKLRDGYRFSPPSSQPVTADAFKRAIERVLDPAMQSPGVPFFSDVTSMTTDGDERLTIRLAHPAGDFLSRLAMPFACAVPPDTPSEPQRSPIPSAGPYYVSGYTEGSRLVLSRNPNYNGPRPSNLDQILYQFNVPFQTTLAQIDSGTADYAAGGVPTSAYAQVAQEHPTRFFVNPLAGLNYIALNTTRPVFSTPAARQAVNLAIDRAALVANNGAYSGTTTDQYIPPTVPGFRDESIYPLAGPSAADLARANALGDQAGIRGKTAVLYTSTNPTRLAGAQLIKDQLARIGIVVEIHAFPRGEQIGREGTLGEPFDMTMEGWINDYLDPFDTLNLWFDGTTIRPSFNNNISYFDVPSINAQLHAAAQLTGPDRYTTYGNLDVTLVRGYAPLVVYGTLNARDYFSDRTGCQTFVPPYGMDLAALCIKGAKRK